MINLICFQRDLATKHFNFQTTVPLPTSHIQLIHNTTLPSGTANTICDFPQKHPFSLLYPPRRDSFPDVLSPSICGLPHRTTTINRFNKLFFLFSPRAPFFKGDSLQICLLNSSRCSDVDWFCLSRIKLFDSEWK